MTFGGKTYSYQSKHHLRALFRSLSFVALVAVFAFYGLTSENEAPTHRRLEEQQQEGDAACADKTIADPAWMLAFYVAGVLYMFLGLAIVCDEFFVPALEEMSGQNHLNLCMDIAGATLMAAGGSAPELFTALFGTFQESAVGFGTIVGSAVFNVLFVIGMCSLLSKELLQLTWWPLFRDSIYYVAGLTVLAVFVGVVSPGEVELWEALVLFVMYIGYVIVMAYNQKLYKMITGKELETDDDTVNGDQEGNAYFLQEGDKKDLEKATSRSESKKRPTSFRWPGSFRAGVVKLITKPDSWTNTVGANLVANIEGDLDAVFEHVDTDGDKLVDKDELKKVLHELNIYLSNDEFEELYSGLDIDKDGKINKSEFEKWYVLSEQRMLNRVEKTFLDLDTDKSGTIGREEVTKLLHEISGSATDAEVSNALKGMYQSGDENEITFKEFSDWYKDSLFYERQKMQANEACEGIFASLKPPKEGGVVAYAYYVLLLPLVVTLAFTVPDVRRPGMGKYCYLGFFLAIVWIGVYSYFMVEWATVVGATIGIPDIIMGLTFLAAGTSVPDLLSSVIVARRGEGDMAVSSSIGSNIFDILVGLPLPWILYTAWPTTASTVSIGADGVGASIGILVGMIGLIIVTIHMNGWKLTKTAGVMMFVFYAAFVIQAIFRELPFESC